MSAKARRLRPSLPHRLPLRAAILAALSAAPVLPAAAVPPGGALDASEFLVGTNTSTNHTQGRIARDAAGDFVVVWTSNNQASSTSSFDIYAQRYNAAGQPQGSDFLVNTFTTGSQDSPSVAMDATGDFVVTWTSHDQASSTSGYDIYARRYNAAGTALQASEFLVNTYTSGLQANSVVAMDAAGNFVVAWDSQNQLSSASGYDIYARQFSAAGSALQVSEFLVNTITSTSEAFPSVAMDMTGDFVVAWQGLQPPVASGSTLDVYWRQYNRLGVAQQATETLANTFSTGHTGGLVYLSVARMRQAISSWPGTACFRPSPAPLPLKSMPASTTLRARPCRRPNSW